MGKASFLADRDMVVYPVTAGFVEPPFLPGCAAVRIHRSPQRLKPHLFLTIYVRAEARTLQVGFCTELKAIPQGLMPVILNRLRHD
jgi:hypothetical protein